MVLQGNDVIYVRLFKDITKDKINEAGGKGANLGEMANNGFPVPQGFIVTAMAYSDFLEKSGIKDSIIEKAESIDVNSNDELESKSKEIRDTILNTAMPEEIRVEIRKNYEKFSVHEEVHSLKNAISDLVKAARDSMVVAVRSSATAEDLPEASFAGQQSTYLNVRGTSEVIMSVQKCWASLFTARAIYYRKKNGFSEKEVSIAVVVQKMINADKSGVIFTANPTNNNRDQMVIESVWGLGEGIVSGAVTPDTYVIDKTKNKIISTKIGRKEIMFVRGDDGSTTKENVRDEKKEASVLNKNEISVLASIAEKIERHYESPQDIEWAIERDRAYIVQSRAITTLDKNTPHEALEEKSEPVLEGLSASPGVATGTVRIVRDKSELGKIEKGDILVTKMTTPDMVPAMERAAGIITDEGGSTCHAAIVSRELGIPSVVGTKTATSTFSEGDVVTVDGSTGKVYKGDVHIEEKASEFTAEIKGSLGEKPNDLMIATKIKVNIDFPELAEKTKDLADGVGLLRAEHMIMKHGKHPDYFIKSGKQDELVRSIEEDMGKVVEAFHGKPVWFRTLDAPTDEFRTLDGGENEPQEANPMLGWRGIRRGISEPELFKTQLLAISNLVNKGYDNIGIMLPLVQHPDEVIAAKQMAKDVGLDLKKVEFGIMVETPAAATIIEDFAKTGIDFISIGSNDLTQYMLAVDRNNSNVAGMYSEMHPAVLKAIENIIKGYKEFGIKTSLCGQSGSSPEMAEKLVGFGIDSISVNIDAINMIRLVAARTERKLLLNLLREGRLKK